MTNDDPITLTGPTDGELEVLAGLAATCQADPQRICVYTGDDADTIAADVADVDDWPERLVVARRAGEPAGWLLAEIDHDMGRVWWWGPFISDPDWHAVADRLYARGVEVVTATGLDGPGEEFAADAESTLYADFAARHGFTAEEGSACLVLRPAPDGPSTGADAPATNVAVVPLAPDHHDAVARLHDELFAGTHTTGHALVESTDVRHVRLVAVVDDRPVGYVATEHQHDGSLYIDFLGVEPGSQGQGIGRALVSEACRTGFALGASHAHLTVRASNEGARALYASLGFEEERVLAPYRRGFSIESPSPG